MNRKVKHTPNPSPTRQTHAQEEGMRFSRMEALTLRAILKRIHVSALIALGLLLTRSFYEKKKKKKRRKKDSIESYKMMMLTKF